MTLLALITLGISIGFFVVQGVLVAQFALVARKKSRRISRSSEPSVAVVLCVRGNDPSLPSCIKSIATQDYNRKTLVIVSDDKDDPGLKTVKELLNRFPNVESKVFINTEIQSTCSLKCSNLVYAMKQIESDYKFFALVDADTTPPSNWLRLLLAPFENPDVAVSTGIRWFEATGNQVGTLVRYIWNAAAIVQMVCYKIPWGGSLAIRSSFLSKANVLEKWSHGFCEDTMLQKICYANKSRVAVVPDAVLPSREEITLSECVPWISRQLLTTRLHHPKWPLILMHGFFTAILSFGTIAMLITCGFMKMWDPFVLFVYSFIGVQTGNILLLLWIRAVVAKKLSGRPKHRSGVVSFLKGVAFTQLSYPFALLKTIFLKHVTWRQIDYRINKGSVELVSYQKYEPDELDEDTPSKNESL